MLKTFTYQGNELPVTFHKKTKVKDGVSCDAYTFVNDDSKDLAIVTVESGASTPRQRVLKGDVTLEGYVSGAGNLVVNRSDGSTKTYHFPGHNEVEVRVGDVMQWTATEELQFYEICYPPFESDRFENLD